ncbi:MAG TPA: hypothetical protein VLD60_08705 [Nitrospira sp.]|nr:hypothetical protein [Nitrospira sp.]
MKRVLRRNPAPVLIFIILIVAASGTLAADDQFQSTVDGLPNHQTCSQAV